jgi:hypothetical protein
LQDAYQGKRFSDGQAGEANANADLADSMFRIRIGGQMAEEAGRSRLRAAKLGAKYRDAQMEKQMDFQREMMKSQQRAAGQAQSRSTFGQIAGTVISAGAMLL